MAEGQEDAGHSPDSCEENDSPTIRYNEACRPTEQSISNLQEVNNCSMLITTITTGDLDKCLQLLDLVSQDELNELARVSNNDGIFKVTPLLWAVIHSRATIVKLMINKGANVNRQGYFENEHITHTYTPLMRALDNRDREIVEMLLAAGADPYSRVSDTDGKPTQEVYPVAKAFATDDLEIVQTFMQRYDPTTYNINKYHMCLCFVLCKHTLTNWFEIVRCIISYGGKVCSGLVVRNPTDKGMCYYFKLLAVRLAFTIHHIEFGYKFECNFDSFKLLSLVCKTDYNRPNSSIVKVLKKNFSFFDKARVGNVNNFTCKRSYECFNEVLTFCETPSRLKQICCVTIRDNIRRLSPEKCTQLPLPSALQRYVAFLDEN